VLRALADPASLYVPVWQHKSLIFTGPSPRAVFMGAGAQDAADEPILLGEFRGRAAFALELSAPPANALDGAGFLVGRWQGGELAAPGTTLYRDQSFDAALGEYLRSEAAVLPVAADELEPRFLGTVSRQDLLLAL